MKKASVWFLIALSLWLLCPGALAEEEDYSYSEAPPRPVLMVKSPLPGHTYEKGDKLTVTASCQGASRMTATLLFPDGEEMILESPDPDQLSHVFTPREGAHFTTAASLVIEAYMPDGQRATQTLRILSPKDQLIRDMFAEAYANSKDKRYRFAPAQDDWHVGVCKNFVMRLFDTFSGAYAMAEYPQLPLYMPKNKSKKDSAPYDYGIEWRPEGPADGAPFEIAAQFKYDPSLSKQENLDKCRQVLHSVQRGDFFQMVGYYYYGNGPHSMLFMSDYNPETDEVHWTDSNMKGERVDGVRWGYLQYDAVKNAEWFVEAICTQNRGCTIYRLRDDLFVK